MPGAASGYVHSGLRIGDVIDAGTPRGSFVLRPGDRPVVLISAGIGATPVLAMLYVLAEHPERQVWWLHGARNGSEHPFEEEARAVLARLPDAHRIVCHSHPRPQDRDFDSTGRITADVLRKADVPAEADFYLCGPARFMHDIAAVLTARVPRRTGSAARVFGPAEAVAPDVVDATKRSPHPPAGQPGPGPLISFSRSKFVGHVGPSLRQPPRVRRGLRRPRQVQLPQRRLPHVRDRAGQRRGQLPA
ncbi:MAG: hypothetical protein ABJB47_01050 [Actinomycetota bacterium]